MKTSLKIFQLEQHLFIVLHKMAPQDTKTNQTKLISPTTVHSLKAAIFRTMAFKLSLEINNDQITP